MTLFRMFLVTMSCLALVSCFDSDSKTDPEKSSDQGETIESSGKDIENQEETDFAQALKRKQSLSSELERLKDSLAEADEIIEQEMAASSELEAINSYRVALEETKAEIESSLEFWREATRKSFAGVQLPEIQTSDGRRYRGVTLLNVGDTHLEFSHEGGSASVEITSLPVGLRKNLIHEPTVLNQ